MEKTRAAIVIIWSVVLLVTYVFLIPHSNIIVHDYDSSHRDRLVDAIALVAMGDMAQDSMIDFSISSIRKMGNWRGEIYIMTDRKECFAEAAMTYTLKVIELSPLDSVIEIKALKPKLLQYLPGNVNSVLYLDVDIIVTRDLGYFLMDLRDTVTRSAQFKEAHSNMGSLIPDATSSNKSLGLFDYGAFLDARGHYVGFCSGCEKWHTGVVWLQRRASVTPHLNSVSNSTDGDGTSRQDAAMTSESESACLKAWERVLLSGRFNTDQESMDEAERQGACPNALTLPGKHLLFAKDYIGMALTSGQTFLHLTAAGRLQSQDYFYREIVVPRLRNSLRPTLNPHSIMQKKIC